MSRTEKETLFHIYTLLHQTAHGVARLREHELQTEGSVTSSRLGILMAAQILGNRATPTEISRWLFRKPHNISIITDKMEKEGVIRKVGDLAQKNQVRIEITEKGYDALKRIPERKSLQRIMSCLSEDELAQFVSYMERIWDGTLQEMGLLARPPFPAAEFTANHNRKALPRRKQNEGA